MKGILINDPVGGWVVEYLDKLTNRKIYFPLYTNIITPANDSYEITMKAGKIVLFEVKTVAVGTNEWDITHMDVAILLPGTQQCCEISKAQLN